MTDQRARFAQHVAEDVNALEKRVNDLDLKIESGGAAGITPHIGDNGNWWIGDTDTLKPARGEQGVQGLRGERGLPGERGLQGLQGAAGVNGDKGEKGEPGAKGEKGLQGLPGKDGAAGAKGSDGMHGKDGAQGLRGFDGAPGEKGRDGVDGLPGTPGKNGVDGKDGKSAYQIAVAQGFAGSEAAWLLSLKGEKGEKGDPGSGGSGTDTAALQQEINALKAVLAKMPKYKEYQAGYIPRANFVGTLGNSVLITANYPKPFSKRPILNVTLDIADATGRVQYVNNATETGFQVATNFAGSMNGVWYEAFILEN